MAQLFRCDELLLFFFSFSIHKLSFQIKRNNPVNKIMSKFLCDACCVFSGIFIRMAHFILLVSEIGKFFSNIRCILFRLVFSSCSSLCENTIKISTETILKMIQPTRTKQTILRNHNKKWKRETGCQRRFNDKTSQQKNTKPKKGK